MVLNDDTLVVVSYGRGKMKKQITKMDWKIAVCLRLRETEREREWRFVKVKA